MLVSVGLTVQAQRGGNRQSGGGERFQGGSMIEGNVPYDGKFTFARLSYQSFFGGGRRGAGPPWLHDYPRGERPFMRILNEVSLVGPHMDESNILPSTTRSS